MNLLKDMTSEMEEALDAYCTANDWAKLRPSEMGRITASIAMGYFANAVSAVAAPHPERNG